VGGPAPIGRFGEKKNAFVLSAMERNGDSSVVLPSAQPLHRLRYSGSSDEY
jgi:hypothetical protein